MDASQAVANALAGFFTANTSGDAATFETVVSADEAVLAVGSAAHEWFAGQEAVRSAYGLEGVDIDPGEVAGWQNGQTGWAVARPTFSMPGGPSLRLRCTGIFVAEDGRWKLVHLHASFPVPDEVAVEHPEWWDRG